MEQVLVVNRAALEARLGPGPFLSQNLETIRQFILDHHTFLPVSYTHLTLPTT